jgi:hypothetical protein
MKSIRLLLACTLAAFASVALVRAEGSCEKKTAASCGACPAAKKDAEKCSKDACCEGASACAKPEKKEAPKTTS